MFLSEKKMSDASRTSSTLNLFKSQDGYPIERKAIDTSGRLGSVYDALTDNLIDRHSVKKADSKTPGTRYVCRLLSGHSSKYLTDVLKDIDFDDALRQSICLKMVAPNGISRLVEYDEPINENTRFLYYAYRVKKEWLEVATNKADKIVAAPQNPTEATHMITRILWGFEILCIIQISKHQPVNTIDQLLSDICDQLKNNKIPIKINKANQQIINELSSVGVYGTETCINQNTASLLSILTRIQDWQKYSSFHQPITYTMQPLRWLYNNPLFDVPCTFPRSDNPHLVQIESTTNRITDQIKDLQYILRNVPADLSSITLNQRLKYILQKYNFILNIFDKLLERLRQSLANIRRHREEPVIVDSIVEDKCFEGLQNIEMDQLINSAHRLLQKLIFIEDMKNNRIDYVNAADLSSNAETSITVDDTSSIMKRIYSDKDLSVILWYSSDRLKREEEDRYQQIYQELTLEQQLLEKRVKLVYVDFTYVKEKLEDFVILRLPEGTSIDEDGLTRDPRHTETADEFSRSPRAVPPPRPPHRPMFKPTDPPPVPPREPVSKSRPAEVNILLLGETGAGKSTLINAFANYFQFETLQQAEQGQPAILTPISFLITLGDRSDDSFVKVDTVESNESLGRSVTQTCKSYAFELSNKLRLRLIDTPGIGDHRGSNSGTQAMNRILNYVNNLSHLNAICFVFKSNTSRLNPFFRSCIDSLVNYLTPTCYNNMIFCFTHARATNYEVGNVAQLLSEVLDDEDLSEVPFRRENTFCIDNESFLYVATRKNGIACDKFRAEECVASWNASMAESIRLLTYVQQCRPCNLERTLSPGKTMFNIDTFAHPLMETLRLIIYNWQLSEAKLTDNQLVLSSSPVDTDMCSDCAQAKPIEKGPFWLTQYQPATFKNNVNENHRCSTNEKHFLIESNISYELIPLPAGLKNERWLSTFHNFIFRCDQIFRFLKQQEPPCRDDPFERILERYLDEEEDISRTCNMDSKLNQSIHEVLRSIKEIRRENWQKLSESNETLSLAELNRIVVELTAMPTVKRQMDAIKSSRQLKLAKQELVMEKSLIKNSILT